MCVLEVHLELLQVIGAPLWFRYKFIVYAVENGARGESEMPSPLNGCYLDATVALDALEAGTTHNLSSAYWSSVRNIGCPFTMSPVSWQ